MFQATSLHCSTTVGNIVGKLLKLPKMAISNKLNISAIKSAKAENKPYRLSDGKGLFLLVNPNGAKWWRFHYRFQNKQKTLSMGVFPEVGLAKARDKISEARQLLADGMDPSEKRKESKSHSINNFKAVALKWIELKSNKWKDSHTAEVRRTLELNIFPFIGDKHIGSISTQEIIKVLKVVESRGSLEMLNKLRQRCNGVFVYAKVMGIIESNPVEGIEMVLKTPVRKNFNSIQPSELPELINAMKTAPMEPVTKVGLWIALYTFQRVNEIRFAEWSEFDFEKQLWTIPSERMKMKREHIVPLPNQAVKLFLELKPITGHSPYVFASSHKPQKQPFSENAMLFALYRMGFRGRMTVHGFRHLGSTTLNEMGYDSRYIEKQLSHEDRNTIRGAYNKAEYLSERVDMMQFWANFIDQ